jgi:thiamine-phosphate pyrophosphorylase
MEEPGKRLMTSFSNFRGLYAITDADLLPDERLYAAVNAAVQGGAMLVQYRDKSADAATRKLKATRLLETCNALSCPLIINDDLDLAAAIGAQGVHLGREDGDLARARKQLGPEAIIGATCHGSLEFAREAKMMGASYVAFGAFFPSPTKPHAIPAALAILNQAKHEIGLPVVAIGGITLDNAADVIRAGADMIAVVSSLFGADDVTQRARAFHHLFD